MSNWAQNQPVSELRRHCDDPSAWLPNDDSRFDERLGNCSTKWSGEVRAMLGPVGAKTCNGIAVSIKRNTTECKLLSAGLTDDWCRLTDFDPPTLHERAKQLHS